MRIFTWHVHGSYLYSLVHARQHEFFVPVGERHGAGGRAGPFVWPDNLHEVAVDEVRHERFDVVLTQSRESFTTERHELLSAAQLRLPHVHIEHDPPRASPTDTSHFVNDPNVLLVHVTRFNELMWDSGRTPTRVIEHGVAVPSSLSWMGEEARGLVVVNMLRQRGRRLGSDVFDRVARHVPLDLAGMRSEHEGGLGDLPLGELWRRAVRYRFFFNPIRWTSFGMAVCEAMMLGMPIVGLATTAMPDVIRHGVHGVLSNDVDDLVAQMRLLLRDRAEAARLGAAGRALARERFGIDRFVRDWDDVFTTVAA